mgnify:CR=1 FL=1
MNNYFVPWLPFAIVQSETNFENPRPGKNRLPHFGLGHFPQSRVEDPGTAMGEKALDSNPRPFPLLEFVSSPAHWNFFAKPWNLWSLAHRG